MRRPVRIAALGAVALLIVAGAACAVFIAGTLGQVLAFVLIAAGLVFATSLVFLEVGLSEDQERDRERRRQRELERRRAVAGARRPGAPSRLARLRGQRRRLK